METINHELMEWLQQMGVADGNLPMVQRIVVIAAILLIAYVLDMIARKAVIPLVHKVTAKTQSNWDDHL
jgi:miniconductance mechanosensitive channel